MLRSLASLANGAPEPPTNPERFAKGWNGDLSNCAHVKTSRGLKANPPGRPLQADRRKQLAF